MIKTKVQKIKNNICRLIKSHIKFLQSKICIFNQVLSNQPFSFLFRYIFENPSFTMTLSFSGSTNSSSPFRVKFVSPAEQTTLQFSSILDLSNGSIVLYSDPLMEHFEAKIFPPSQITSANAVPKSVIHLYLNIAPKQL